MNPYSQLNVSHFAEGLNTDHPTSIPDHALARADNIQYTQEHKVAPKPGIMKRFASDFDSSPVVGIAPYYKSDGTTRLVMAAGTSLYTDTPHLIFSYDAQSDWENGVTNLDTTTTAGSLQLPAAPAVTSQSISYQEGKYGNGASMGSTADYLYSLQGGTTDMYRYYTKGNRWSALTAVPVSVGAGGAIASAGSDVYALMGGNTAAFKKYSGGAWTDLADAPGNITTGGALVYGGGDYLYAFQGGSTAFYRYSISGDTWSSMAGAPGTTGAGGALVWTYGDYIYATQGGTGAFWRYSISGNSWATRAATTYPTGSGASLAWDGSDTIYAVLGYGVYFYAYSISGNTWTAKAAVTAAPGAGSSLVYDGTNSFYCIRGGGTTDVYRYRPSVGASGTWDTMTVSSEAINAGGSLARIGDYFYSTVGGTGFYKYAIPWKKMAAAPGTLNYGSLCSGGGDYLYVTQGNATTAFWRYSISGNSWSSLTAAPAGMGAGGSLVWTGGDYIYATQGGGQPGFHRYSISGNSWSSLANAPSGISYGAGLVWTGGDYLYTACGGTYADFYRYSISGNTWSAMTAAPAGVHVGGSLQWGGGDYLYAVRGNGTQSFYRYSISGNSWVTLANAPVAISNGGASAYPGGDYIYLQMGANQYRYSISAGTWSGALIGQPASNTIGTSAGSGSRPTLYYTLPKAMPKHNFGALWYIPDVDSTALTNPVFMSAFNASNPAVQRYALDYSSGTFRFRKYDGATWYSCDSGATSFSAGDTILLAWLDDGTNMKLWVGVNSAALSAYAFSSAVEVTDAKKIYWGGNGTAGNEANGVLDDIQMYDVSLMEASNAPFAESFLTAIYESGASQTWGLFTILHSTLSDTTAVDANRQGMWVSPTQDASASTAKDSLTITWTADVPTSTTLSAQVATSADGTTWSAWYDQTNGAAATAPTNTYSKLRYILQEVSNAGTPDLAVATASYDGEPTAATLTTGLSTSTQYTAAQLLDKLIVCNGVDLPKAYDGSSASDLTAAPKASLVCVYKNRVFMAKDANNKSRIYYSDLSNVTSWPVDNWIDVNPNDGDEIMALVPMDTTLLVVKGHQAYYLQGYNQQTFQVVPAGNGGTLSARGAIWTQYGVFRLDREGVWATDFARQILLTKEKNIQAYWSGLNQRQLSKAALFVYQDKLLVSVPDGSSLVNNTVFQYDLSTKKWSRWLGWYPSCFTSYWESGQWLYLFGSSQSGNVYQIGGADDAGAAFTATIETKHFNMADQISLKRVKWCDFSFAGGTTDTTIGISAITDGIYSAEKTVTIPANSNNFPFRISTPAYARVMGFRIRWIDTGSTGATLLGMQLAFFDRTARPTRVI